MVPFRSFQHNITPEDQINSLKNFKKHLVPNGKLIINFFFPKPDLMLKKLGKSWKKIKIKTEKGDFILGGRYYFIDEINQNVNFKQVVSRDNKIIKELDFNMTYIFKREFELLLKLAGFKKWKVYGEFNYKPLKEKTQEMVWVVEK